MDQLAKEDVHFYMLCPAKVTVKYILFECLQYIELAYKQQPPETTLNPWSFYKIIQYTCYIFKCWSSAINNCWCLKIFLKTILVNSNLFIVIWNNSSYIWSVLAAGWVIFPIISQVENPNSWDFSILIVTLSYHWNLNISFSLFLNTYVSFRSWTRSEAWGHGRQKNVALKRTEDPRWSTTIGRHCHLAIGCSESAVPCEATVSDKHIIIFCIYC